MSYITPDLTLVGSAAGLVLGSKVELPPVPDSQIYSVVPPGFDASKAYSLGADSDW
jgi:hypothetical protein